MVIFTLLLVGWMLWRHACTIRRWERDTALFNAWSGCDMSVADYRAWILGRNA